MIIPITLFLAFCTTRKKKTANTEKKFDFIKIFPWFVLGFIAAAFMNTFIVFPEWLKTSMVYSGKFAIVMAMAAIGLKTNLAKLIKSGRKSILLGLICWIVLSVTSLAVQYLIL